MPLAFGDEAFEEAYPNFGLPVTYFLDEDGSVTEVFNGILTPERLEELTAGSRPDDGPVRAAARTRRWGPPPARQ